MLPVVLINERDLRTALLQHPGLAGEFAHYPLVPAGDEHVFGVKLQRVVPLLLHVVAVFIRVFGELLVPVFVGVAAAEGVFRVEVRADALRVAVLRHADGAHLESAVGPGAVAVLGRHLQPAPLVVPPGTARVQRLAGPEREEFADLVQDFGVIIRDAFFGDRFGVRHDHGLAFPHEPQVAEFARLVQILINAAEHADGVVRGAELHHERHLRGVDAVAAGFVQFGEQRHERVAPYQRAVGGIEHHHVHARVGKILRVLADHVRIVVAVEAVERFVPVDDVVGGPGGMLHIVLRFGIFREDLGEVAGRAAIAVAVPPGPV